MRDVGVSPVEMTLFISKIKRILAAFGIAVVLLGCTASERSLAPNDMVAVSIGAVGHYGSMIGIPEFTVNGHWGGNNSGWGGGGGGVCCVLLPMKVTEPVMVTVKWETYRSNVDEALYHEKKVPVKFAVLPKDSGSFTIHFMPGHTVEAWVTKEYPEGSNYPGPLYPRGPAPRYVPLHGEKQQPVLAEEIR